MESKIKGIKCVAEKCKYHTPDDCCTAGEIVVANESACTSCETECKTFAPKN